MRRVVVRIALGRMGVAAAGIGAASGSNGASISITRAPSPFTIASMT